MLSKTIGRTVENVSCLCRLWWTSQMSRYSSAYSSGSTTWTDSSPCWSTAGKSTRPSEIHLALFWETASLAETYIRLGPRSALEGLWSIVYEPHSIVPKPAYQRFITVYFFAMFVESFLVCQLPLQHEGLPARVWQTLANSNDFTITGTRSIRRVGREPQRGAADNFECLELPPTAYSHTQTGLWLLLRTSKTEIFQTCTLCFSFLHGFSPQKLMGFCQTIELQHETRPWIYIPSPSRSITNALHFRDLLKSFGLSWPNKGSHLGWTSKFWLCRKLWRWHPVGPGILTAWQ